MYSQAKLVFAALKVELSFNYSDITLIEKEFLKFYIYVRLQEIAAKKYNVKKRMRMVIALETNKKQLSACSFMAMAMYEMIRKCKKDSEHRKKCHAASEYLHAAKASRKAFTENERSGLVIVENWVNTQIAIQPYPEDH